MAIYVITAYIQRLKNMKSTLKSPWDQVSTVKQGTVVSYVNSIACCLLVFMVPKGKILNSQAVRYGLHLY